MPTHQKASTISPNTAKTYGRVKLKRRSKKPVKLLKLNYNKSKNFPPVRPKFKISKTKISVKIPPQASPLRTTARPSTCKKFSQTTDSSSSAVQNLTNNRSQIQPKP